MMVWRFNELRDEYKRKTGHILSIRTIAADTGLNKYTICRISVGHTKQPDEHTMSALLIYLSDKLERPLQTGDLWRLVRD